jgi:hypothetical protein
VKGRPGTEDELLQLPNGPRIGRAVSRRSVPRLQRMIGMIHLLSWSVPSSQSGTVGLADLIWRCGPDLGWSYDTCLRPGRTLPARTAAGQSCKAQLPNVHMVPRTVEGQISVARIMNLVLERYGQRQSPPLGLRRRSRAASLEQK